MSEPTCQIFDDGLWRMVTESEIEELKRNRISYYFRAIYPEPDPRDELRKAADDLLKVIYDPCVEITPLIENLRAALEKK